MEGGLERDERVVEALVELARVGVRLDHDPALLAELVEPQPLAAQALHVLAVRVEDGDAAQLARELGGGDAADGAAADHEHGGVDHPSPSSSASRPESAA